MKTEDPGLRLADGMGPHWRQQEGGELAWDQLTARVHVEMSPDGNRIVVSPRPKASDRPGVARAELGAAAEWIMDHWSENVIWMTLDRMSAAEARRVVAWRVCGFTGSGRLEPQRLNPNDKVWVIVTASDVVSTDREGRRRGEREVWVEVVMQSGKSLGLGWDPRLETSWTPPCRPPPPDVPGMDGAGPEEEDPNVQFAIGLSCYDGQDVTEDAEEAVRWLRRAAEQGHAAAQCALAACYEEGAGVVRHVETAVAWYRRAAAQGSAKAHYELGYRYLRGEGVGRNETEGAKHLHRAAEQGYAYGMAMLAICYRHGRGVGTDLVQAYKWYSAAMAAGLPLEPDMKARELAHFEIGMTPQQIAEAKALAREFRPKGTRH